MKRSKKYTEQKPICGINVCRSQIIGRKNYSRAAHDYSGRLSFQNRRFDFFSEHILSHFALQVPRFVRVYEHCRRKNDQIYADFE